MVPQGKAGFCCQDSGAEKNYQFKVEKAFKKDIDRGIRKRPRSGNRTVGVCVMGTVEIYGF